jgi:tetratricopeptide (TPR) repeat protein
MSSIVTEVEDSKKDSSGGNIPVSQDEKGAVHGVGDRSSYYNKWDKFTKDEVATIEDEEKKNKERIELETANIPRSEAEKKDLEKRKMLKNAKKLWDGISAQQESQKKVIANENGLSDREVKCDEGTASQVLVLKDNTECHYSIPESEKPIKLFVDGCRKCSILLHCSMVTSHIEISHCEDVTITITKKMISTVQVDLSENITVYFKQNMMNEKCKVYHCAVRSIHLKYDHDGTGKDEKIQDLDDYELSQLNANLQSGTTSSDQQFITTYLNADFITDLVLRDITGHPTTLKEIDARKAKLAEATKARHRGINDEQVEQILQEIDALTPIRQANIYKDKGNVSFKECAYAQAAVHYTQAIECLTVLTIGHTEGRLLLCNTLSNRAACCLKLGDHANTLTDVDKALEIIPTHVKSHFRKGLALHALGRYREAAPCLSAALDLEPSNKQIKEALTFAERKLFMTASGMSK